MKTTPITLLALCLLMSCSNDKKLAPKGFPVQNTTVENIQSDINAIRDSTAFLTRPRNVLLTGHKEHRFTPIFKVNYTKKDNKPFVGSIYTHHNYTRMANNKNNNWHNNFMPGFEAVYGYNLVNLSHFNHKSNTQKQLFESPVLIKTFYYPTQSKDTLNGQAIQRDYYLVSVYDEDSNKDGYISTKDLRKLYHFDLNTATKTPLIPADYSVLSSEYDPANDFMYIHASKDENGNGQMEYEEAIHIFWIDLKAPQNKGLQYEKE